MSLSLRESQFSSELSSELLSDYKQFISYQEIVLDLLNVFHTICLKTNIDYYLAYGSLLGAIRDKGQIPWDYDVDVWVYQSDVENLIKALDTYLPSDYYYVTRFKCKSDRHYMMRIAPKNYSSEVLHVDVFWLFGAPNSSSDVSLMNSLYARSRNLGMFKHCPLHFLTWKMSPVHSLKIVMMKLLSSCVPDRYIDNLHKKAIALASSDFKYITDEYGILFKKDFFAEKQLIQFPNGMSFFVPLGYESILSSLYGDYLKLPPLSQRINEFLSSLDRIKTLGFK